MPDFNDARLSDGNNPVFFVTPKTPTQQVANSISAVEGVVGPTGPQGLPGPQGPQGIPGAQGPKGDQGDTGPKGDRGDMGLQGVKGDQGDVGPAGPAGPTGPQGPTGSAGAQGPQGIQGPQGVQGPIGPAGPGMANAVINGSQHLIITTADSQVFDAGYIPSGQTGATGATGPTGPQGAQGLQGPQGIQGLQGPQGATGATGAKGDKGDAFETVVNVGTPSSPYAPDLALNGGTNLFNILLGASPLVINLPTTGLSAARTYSAVFAIKQGASGVTVTWQRGGSTTGIATPNDVTYVQSTLSGAVDLYTAFTYDGGATYLVTQVGQNYR